MSQEVTTTRNGFRVEDITFKGARRQCEIEEDIDRGDNTDTSNIQVPISLTPEQVKAFYMLKIANAKDYNEKRVYSQTIRWIDELLETKKKLFALEAKEVVENDDGTADSIEE